MDPQLQTRIEALEKKIDAIHTSVEKIRTYLKWTAIITIAVIVLPTVGLMFAIPQFLSYYGDLSQITTLGM